MNRKDPVFKRAEIDGELTKRELRYLEAKDTLEPRYPITLLLRESFLVRLHRAMVRGLIDVDDLLQMGIDVYEERLEAADRFVARVRQSGQESPDVVEEPEAEARARRKRKTPVPADPSENEGLTKLPASLVDIPLDHPIFGKGKSGKGPFEVSLVKRRKISQAGEPEE